MASQGPLSAGAGAVDTSFGTRTWTSTEGNITASDNTRAVSQVLASGQITQYLKSSAHGFTIPAGSTIDGIVVEIERHQSAAQNVRDSRVRIVKADGSIGTTARADTTTDWPTSDTIKTYGSSSDLWGETWTPADINDADFGVVLAATNASATNSAARVDHIRITVYYTAGGTPQALAGQIDGAATAAGDLIASHPLGGSAAGIGTAGGDLIASHPLAGQADGVGAAQGDLTEQIYLLGTAAGASTVEGDLIVSHPLAGTVAGSGDIVGDLLRTLALVGDASGASTAVADLIVARALAGLAAGSSDAEALLMVLEAEDPWQPASARLGQILDDHEGALSKERAGALLKETIG